jgi:hypothetical protein
MNIKFAYRWLWPALLLLLLPLSAVFPQKADRDYQVKAGFLFNFSQFVDWPPDAFASAEAPLVIGILGANPFGTYLTGMVSGETVKGRPLAVKHCEGLADAETCHILFINQPKDGQLSHILGNLKGKAILTVGDSPHFIAEGGVIRFVKNQRKIRLQINPQNAQAANLIISSNLLRLAEIVSP